MGVGLALLMLWALPSIERRSEIVWTFWVCAFLGGLGRLASAVTVGAPTAPLVGFAVLEVVGAPLMLLWHRRVASGAAPSE